MLRSTWLVESSLLLVRVSIPVPLRKSWDFRWIPSHKSLFERDFGRLALFKRESVLVGLSFQSSRVSCESLRCAGIIAKGILDHFAWSRNTIKRLCSGRDYGKNYFSFVILKINDYIPISKNELSSPLFKRQWKCYMRSQLYFNYMSNDCKFYTGVMFSIRSKNNYLSTKCSNVVYFMIPN